MADAYWRYGDSSREEAASLPTHMPKRSRTHSEMPSSHHMSSYHVHDNDKAGDHVTSDTDSVNASYEHYLCSAPISSYGVETGRSFGDLDGLYEINDLRVLGLGGSNPEVAEQSQFTGARGQPEIPLPPDASSTLFVEGLPANCTRREVSHIFRPFVGYKEVRLVNKGPRHSGGNPVVLCFVDFQSPAHAATAMDALQGYVFDEHDRDSGYLRVQFARNPGARPFGGHRGKH